jgi:type I restriction enzyme S subunit
MDFKTFLENFDAIAEAPGGIQKLRILILDLAVQGKLVPQNLEDEPAEKLLKRIQAEKELLAKEKKIKRKDPLPEIAEDELSYELPKGWALSRLGNLFEIVRGSSPRPKGDLRYFATQKTDFHWIKISDITAYTENNELINTEEYLTEEGTKFSRKVGKQDIIIAASGSVGKACMLGIEGFIYDGLMAVRGINSDILRFYLLCFFKTIELSLLGGATGTSWKNINTDILKNTVIPLPPEKEQYRILTKVDELMGLCDRYEAAKQTRDKLRQKLRESAIASVMNSETDEELDAAWAFVRDHWQNLSQCPEDVNGLREATLQLAIRGKLVSQNINDESVLGLLAQITAEKKHLIKAKKIRDASTLPFEDSAFPCEIPNTWVWERFGNVILDIEAGASPQCESRQKDGDEWGVIKISAVSWNKFNPDENKALPPNMEPRKEFEIKTGDFIMSRANTSQLVGKSVVVENLPPRLLLNDKTLRVLFPTCIEKRFFNLYNNSALARQYYAGGGTGTSDSMKNITREQIRNLPVPVPPLHEQKRIVAKVDELMKLCDQLEASLRQSQQRAESLAASTISHLTI